MARKQQSEADLSFVYRPRSQAQKDAQELWARCRILFFLGEAGTGKTTAALGMSIKEALQTVNKESQNRKKLWLARPAVANDEEHGWVSGTLEEKLGIWSDPFKDCFESLSDSQWDKLKKVIDLSIVSVGLLQGRTLKNGFLIVDECQELTAKQILCICTRLGENSKIIFTGDPAQSNRFDPKRCPIVEAARKLDKMDTIALLNFPAHENLRDPLITEIIQRLK